MPLLTNAAGWSATWEMTESCVTTSCEVLSGSAFVFMRIACYRWNLLHKFIIYLRGFLPRSQACVVRHAVRDSERKGGQDGATHASGWQLCPSSPLLRPPPPSGCHSLHACTHTHTHTGDITVRCHGNQPTTLYPECFTAYELQIDQCWHYNCYYSAFVPNNIQSLF